VRIAIGIRMHRGRIGSLVVAVAALLAGCQHDMTVSDTGALSLTIAGLPTSLGAVITVQGPDGYAANPTATATLGSLVPGTYTIEATLVGAPGAFYTPTVLSQSVSVAANASATAVVTYAPSSGRIAITLGGLPAGTFAPITLSGAGVVVNQTVTGSSTADVPGPGSYQLTATNVTVNGVVYAPSPAAQMVTVVPPGTVTATIQYTAQSTALVLTIDGVYITQAVQRYDFSVPLITDRPGLLRVFLRANQANTVAPDVRVRFYRSGVLAATDTIHAPSVAVPETVTEGVLNSSWNLPIAANLLEPGMQLLIDVDPSSSLALATRSNLGYPASGAPQLLDIRNSAPYDVTFVPVFNAADSTMGDVTATDYTDLMQGVMRLHPMWAYTAQVHAPVTFSGGVLDADDANGAWEQVLQEIETLRLVEGTSRYYYGVVHVNYASGRAGQAYDIPAHTAIGYDARSRNTLVGASETFAHELGHDMGLFHAPGCGAVGPDPAYPYAGAAVGVYGYNVLNNRLSSLTNFDLMGYCSPFWISDYSYARMIELSAGPPPAGLTAAHPVSIAARIVPPAAPQSSYVIAGVFRNGRATIDPVLMVDTRPALPTAGGSYQLLGRDATGATLFQFAFAPAVSPDAPPGGPAHFAFAVPALGASLATMQLTGPGIDTTIAPTAGVSDAVSMQSTRTDASHIRLRWDAARYPLLLVRDAVTGEVLAFGRRGDVTVATTATALNVVVSDRIHAREMRIRP
jgi:hypothetical protein